MLSFSIKWRNIVPALALLGSVVFASVPLAVVPAGAEEIQSSIASGGRLYDNWYSATGAAKPEATHSAWPASNTQKSGAATTRCKACHGWDLMGKDGAYGAGSYFTGIKGLKNLAGGSNDIVIAAIKDSTHGFGDKLSEQNMVDLANFITKGQIDMDAVINRETKAALGDVGKGEAYYNTVCATCHAVDGKLPKELEEPLGALASGNPWEILQKIQNGQPGEQMPAMRAFGIEASVDILTYLQKLPQE